MHITRHMHKYGAIECDSPQIKWTGQPSSATFLFIIDEQQTD